MNRDDVIRMARQVGYPIQHPEWQKATEEFAALVAAAEREAWQPLFKAAQGVINWTEIAHRPPVKVDELEVGRMAGVRLHALIDLHDVIRARGST